MKPGGDKELAATWIGLILVIAIPRTFWIGESGAQGHLMVGSSLISSWLFAGQSKIEIPPNTHNRTDFVISMAYGFYHFFLYG